MSQHHTSHTAEFKARVALAALSGLKNDEEVSREFGVSVCQVSRWKSELVTNAPHLFGAGEKKEYLHEVEIIDLFSRLSRLAEGQTPAAGESTPTPRSTP